MSSSQEQQTSLKRSLQEEEPEEEEQEHDHPAKRFRHLGHEQHWHWNEQWQYQWNGQQQQQPPRPPHAKQPPPGKGKMVMMPAQPFPKQQLTPQQLEQKGEMLMAKAMMKGKGKDKDKDGEKGSKRKSPEQTSTSASASASASAPPSAPSTQQTQMQQAPPQAAQTAQQQAQQPQQLQQQAPPAVAKQPQPAVQPQQQQQPEEPKKKKAKKQRQPEPPALFNQLPLRVNHRVEHSDVEASRKLAETMARRFPAEDNEGMDTRRFVLFTLQRLFEEWAVHYAAYFELDASSEDIRNAVKVSTLGSYRLGVVHCESDIDVVCIGAPWMSRELFFMSFPYVLLCHDEVQEVKPISTAHTPVIKVKMCSVDVDLLFARMSTFNSKKMNLEDLCHDTDVLKQMDGRCIRSLNGLRVADAILDSVPRKDVFRSVLRTIKYWARNRGVYGNVIGFFGGITWSLLVAKLCALHPAAPPNVLVEKFFLMYGNWDWSNPLMINQIVSTPEDLANDPDMQVWNPYKNPADARHVMPVITPCFPCMNSTHNIGRTHKRIMQEEFARAVAITMDIRKGKATWDDLFQNLDIFGKFDHFLVIEVAAKTEDVLDKFINWMDTRCIRQLTTSLEGVPGLEVHPYPLPFRCDKQERRKPFGCGYFFGMRFLPSVYNQKGRIIDMKPVICELIALLEGWSDRDKYPHKVSINIRRCNKDTLPTYLGDP